MSFDEVFGLPGVSPEELPLRFDVVYMVNMQMSFISPLSGYALIFAKERGATGSYHGTDLSIVPALAVLTDNRPGNLYYISGSCIMAGKAGIRLTQENSR